MIITAKFASTCPTCRAPIAVGAKVEWSKGARATHVACPAAGTVAAAPRAARSYAMAPRSKRPWVPCGYPGCNAYHCDDCDGAGGNARSMW